MALLSKKEFGEKCGIPVKDLGNYIKRGKVIMTDDRIDDTNSINVQFFKKREGKVKKEPTVLESAEVVSAPWTNETKPLKEAKKTSAKKPIRDKYDERFDLDSEEKRAKIRKLAREEELADLEQERILKRIAPVDMVRSLMIVMVKNFTVSFKHAADKVVQEFAKKTKMNVNDHAAIKGDLILAINKANQDAMNETKKGLESIVEDYSKARKL